VCFERRALEKGRYNQSGQRVRVAKKIQKGFMMDRKKNHRGSKPLMKIGGEGGGPTGVKDQKKGDANEVGRKEFLAEEKRGKPRTV